MKFVKQSEPINFRLLFCKSDFFRNQLLYLVLATIFFIQPVSAQHLDIEVWGQGNALFAGFCRTSAAVGCDLDSLADALGLPDGTLPSIEAATVKRMLGFLKFQ